MKFLENGSRPQPPTSPNDSLSAWDWDDSLRWWNLENSLRSWTHFLRVRYSNDSLSSWDLDSCLNSWNLPLCVRYSNDALSSWNLDGSPSSWKFRWLIEFVRFLGLIEFAKSGGPHRLCDDMLYSLMISRTQQDIRMSRTQWADFVIIRHSHHKELIMNDASILWSFVTCRRMPYLYRSFSAKEPCN